MQMPMFNTSLGALDLTQQGRPPIRFDGVLGYVFPLKANMYRLTAFCDAYLNVAGDVVRFRPSLPYVFLMALDYGKMSAEVENIGWVSQHEVAFAVPLEWYRWNGRDWEFVDFATVCPFIFVDNEMSLTTGREVYGWPKVKVWLEREVNPWMSSRSHTAHLLSMSTMVYPELYAGQRQQPQIVLQIRQQTQTPLLSFPPDPRNGFNPFLAATKWMNGYMGLMGQFMEAFTSLPLMGYQRAGAAPPWLDLIAQSPRYMDPLSPPPATNQITLKQFRDAEDPDHICYQAIVNSEMSLKRFNSGGFLGDAMRLGDPTAGFEILVRRYDAYPIIESLGIEAEGESALDGNTLSRLEPVFPYWVNVDLEYGIGRAICWRGRNTPWSTSGLVGRSPKDDAKLPPAPFNTTLGDVSPDITGPFEFPNVTLRVLPLLADAKRLKQFCASYLGEGLGEDRPYDFEPWGRYVYLVVTNYGEMSSDTNDIGWWAERDLTFFVPVKWYDRRAKLLSTALIPAFGFADTQTAAITGREVDGQPTVTATIESPESAWLTDAGPAGERQGLLTLETLLLPALRLGQRAEWRQLLEITQADPLDDTDVVRWEMIARRWIRDLLNEVRRKKREGHVARPKADDAAQSQSIGDEIRDMWGGEKDDKPLRPSDQRRKELDDVLALSLEVLANGNPINTVTLKQFRDVERPERACYQAIVRGRRSIDRIYDVREIEERIHLRLRRIPSMPIAKVLGLQAKWTETNQDGTVDVFQPIRPFWMKLALKEHLGENLCWRIGARWSKLAAAERNDKPSRALYFLGGDGDPTGVDVSMVYFAEVFRQALAAGDDLWHSFKEFFGGNRELAEQLFRALPLATARRAVEAIDPQMAIEAILSMEWENRGNPRWQQNVRALREGRDPDLAIDRKPDFCIPCHSIGEKSTRKDILQTENADAWYFEDWFGDLMVGDTWSADNVKQPPDATAPPATPAAPSTDAAAPAPNATSPSADAPTKAP